MTIDAPLFITCTDHDCAACTDGGPHRLRCHCGAGAVEVLYDDHGALPHCRACLDLLRADSPLSTAERWPASVTERGEHPVFVAPVPACDCYCHADAGDAEICCCCPATGRWVLTCAGQALTLGGHERCTETECLEEREPRYASQAEYDAEHDDEDRAVRW